MKNKNGKSYKTKNIVNKNNLKKSKIESNNNKKEVKEEEIIDKSKINYLDSNNIKIIVVLIAFGLVSLSLYHKNINKSKEEVKKNSYKHLCLNQSLAKDRIIYKTMLKECESDEEISVSDDIIKNFKFANEYAYSKEYYIVDDKDENYILKPNDIYWKLPKNESIKFSSDLGVEYEVKIVDSKAMITNLKTNNVDILFNREPVKHILLRNYYNDKSSKIILITAKNQLYISNDTVTNILNEYNQDVKKIRFEKLSFIDILNVIVNYSEEGSNETESYAVDSAGNKYRID